MVLLGTERIKIGSVPTVFFLFQRVNSRSLFGTDLRRFFLSRGPCRSAVYCKPHAFSYAQEVTPSCALHLRANMADKKKKAARRKAGTKAVEPWKDYKVKILLLTFFQKHFPVLSDTLLLP